MAFEAFVYGYRNQENGKMYIGFRKNSEINDGYVFSSEDPELTKAWGLGLLHRSILYRAPYLPKQFFLATVFLPIQFYPF